jgi:hypothetical protein
MEEEIEVEEDFRDKEDSDSEADDTSVRSEIDRKFRLLTKQVVHDT